MDLGLPVSVWFMHLALDSSLVSISALPQVFHQLKVRLGSIPKKMEDWKA